VRIFEKSSSVRPNSDISRSLPGGDEGIVVGNGVGFVGIVIHIHVDAEDFAEPGGEILAGLQGIAFPTAVARADVEIAVGAERDLTAIVIVIGLLDPQQHLRGRIRALGVHHVRTGGIHLEADDDAVPVERQRRVVDVEIAVGLEVRMEGHRIEALLDKSCLHVIAEWVDGGQVEERIGRRRAVLVYDLDLSYALRDEQSPGPVAGVCNACRIEEAVRHLDQRDRWRAGNCAAGFGHLIGCLGNLSRTRRKGKQAGKARRRNRCRSPHSDLPYDLRVPAPPSPARVAIVAFCWRWLSPTSALLGDASSCH
jgi:hypothetical protein